MKLTKRKLLKLAAGTLIFMSLAGVLIMEWWQEKDLMDQLIGNYPWYYQIILGAVYGTLTALAGWQLVKLPQLAEINNFFSGMIGRLNLNQAEIIFISFCAGTGEEILFRGALQPLMGIWITSILFVLLHGYLNPRNLPMSLYGIYMVLVIAGIGYLAVFNGLVTAITAHFFIDWILISYLKSSYLKNLGP